MTPLTPTITGQAASWTVSPALPAGISLNPGSGVISGTPTVAAASASYKVIASNASGSTSGTLSLTVLGVSIGYLPGNSGNAAPSSSLVFAPGVPAQAMTPLITNSPVSPTAWTSWTISPTLPAGLTFGASSGIIGGLPAATAAAANYTITASDSQGDQLSTTLSISVAGNTLLDLGLAKAVTLIRYVNGSVLSQDASGIWVLQDFASGTTLAEGGAFPTAVFPSNSFTFPFDNTYVDLENTVMIDAAPSTTALEVRSASTGQLLATIPLPAMTCSESTNCAVPWYRLATDGSYVVVGTATALTAWSTSGQMLFSIAGNYSQTESLGMLMGLQPFAAPGQVQLAQGPAGANVIQTITVPGGVSSVSATFQGSFSSWFVDGQRFLTTQGNTGLTYSAAGVQQDATALTTLNGSYVLAGAGNWLWNRDEYNALNVYKVGSSSTPALTISSAGNPVVSGSTMGLLDGTTLTVIDLSGATLTSTSYANVPFALFYTFGAESPTQWLLGNGYGVVLDGTSLAGTPRSLTLGTALSIAAGSTYISVATASGKVLFFNANDDTPAGTIAYPSSQLAASADGTVLAAVADWQLQQQANPTAQTTTDSTLDVYSLPAATLSNSFPYAYPNTGLTTVTLSGSGTVVAETFNSPTTACLIQVLAVAGGAPIVCDNSSGDVNVQLSPDGTLVATSPAPDPNVSTRIYNNGTLVTVVPGYAFGWLDNDHLLLGNYTMTQNSDNQVIGTGLTIYDASGNQVGTSPVITTLQMQIAPGAASLYSSYLNFMVSLSSGATTWTCGSVSSISNNYYGWGEEGSFPPGTAAGVTPSQVVFASSNLVVAVPY